MAPPHPSRRTVRPGFRVSQSASLLADQVSVPPPEFRILNVWLGGFVPSCTAVKLKLAGYSYPSLFNVSDETSDAKNKSYHECTSFQRSDSDIRLLKASPALKPNMAKHPEKDYAHADDK